MKALKTEIINYRLSYFRIFYPSGFRVGNLGRRSTALNRAWEWWERQRSHVQGQNLNRLAGVRPADHWLEIRNSDLFSVLSSQFSVPSSWQRHGMYDGQWGDVSVRFGSWELGLQSISFRNLSFKHGKYYILQKQRLAHKSIWIHWFVFGKEISTLIDNRGERRVPANFTKTLEIPKQLSFWKTCKFEKINIDIIGSRYIDTFWQNIY